MTPIPPPLHPAVIITFILVVGVLSVVALTLSGIGACLLVLLASVVLWVALSGALKDPDKICMRILDIISLRGWK